MSARSPDSCSSGQDAAVAARWSAGPWFARLGIHFIDWRAVRRADRACCCPAKPVVVVVMPPSPGRPNQTDLLLCGHHYRVSRQALLAAGASVLDINGVPLGREGEPDVVEGVYVSSASLR